MSSLNPNPSSLIPSPLRVNKPEEIRLVDPAVGSGHMLTYAFDLLTLIYEEEGYAPTEIPALILRHNLHGLEICPRAAQLAELALVFKAREKDRRFFKKLDQGLGNRGQGVGDKGMQRPHIIELKNITFDEGELPMDWLAVPDQWPMGEVPAKADILHDLYLFTDAKNFGSLLQPKLSEQQLVFLKQRVTNHYPLTPNPLFSNKVREHVLRVLEQAEALTQRYHVVVANPPYMGAKNQTATLKAFLELNFEPFKADLFSAFFVRSRTLALPAGFLGFMSPFVWMFIGSYENLRRELIERASITSLVQLEYSGFDGATVPICCFTLNNQYRPNHKGAFIRLSAFRGAENQAPRTLEAIRNQECGWFYSAATQGKRI